MKRALAIWVMVCCFSASGFAADGPPGPPSPLVVVQFLGFSDAQAGQFQQLLGNLQSTMGAVQPQIEVAQRQLNTLLSQDTPDPALVGAQVLALRTLQRQASRLFETYHQGFLSMLTPEQTQKVQAVVQAAQLLPAVRAFAELKLIAPPQ